MGFKSILNVLVIVPIFLNNIPALHNQQNEQRISENKSTLYIINDSTQGYYNSALGTILDETQPQFPPANTNGSGEPNLNPAPVPDLTVASSILGNWLSSNPTPLNSNWSSLQNIPKQWAVNTEVAIIYPVNIDIPEGVSLIGNFGVDNGMYVWVNGVYQWGATQPGNYYAYEYTNINLGKLHTGLNFIEIILEDHGQVDGFTLSITSSLDLISDSTQGYYNSALGTVLDGTQPQFPPANTNNEPNLDPAPVPDLTVASSILGDWLSANPIPLNSNWSSLQNIPKQWAINTEVAIIYPVNIDTPGGVSLIGNFGVDNGMYVWVNGVYQWGATQPGNYYAYEYTNINLGQLHSGLNYIEIILEDHGGVDGFTLSITGVIPLHYNTLYASTHSDLWMINSDTVASTYIGPIGSNVTDIAFDGLNLYGVSSTNFLSIDPTTGIGTVIGPIYYDDVNALTIGLDGVIYAATAGGAFITIDKFTGKGSLIGYYGPGLGSSGDLAYSYDNKMFASITKSGSSNSWLAEINLVTGAATPIGDIGYPDVLGLSFKNKILYGVTTGGDILTINKTTGASTNIGHSNAVFGGLSTSGTQLTGSITSPIDNLTTAPASFQITATAEYPGGNGVKQVEFYVFYDGDWHSAGSDTTAPYTAVFDTPLNFDSQQVLFRIDVVGNDSYRVEYAGGVRHVNIILSYGNPNIKENWISNRAYLNQRSLNPDGDDKCSASSMAMVLASQSVIDSDYQSMAYKANEMYPKVLGNDGRAYVWKMRNEFTNQGAYGIYFGPISANDGWDWLKTYINAGYPVVVRSADGVVTPKGHFIEAVGYKEELGKRYIIAYDPFGQWRGIPCNQLPGNCANNYYTNAPNDPLSHVGQWVIYDFDLFFGDYLIAAHAPLSPLSYYAPTSLTPPDIVSDEPKIIGTYDGVILGDAYRLFLPAINR